MPPQLLLRRHRLSDPPLPFEIDTALQARVGHAIRSAAGPKIRLPYEFARLSATYAYLGEIDVRPLTNPAGGSGTVKRCELWAAPEPGSADLYRLTGQSDVAADPTPRPDGAQFRHTVTLRWEGFLQLEGDRIRSLDLLAHGKESVRWSSGGNGPEPLVARLPAGRNLDVTTDVGYGLVGKPYSVPALAPPTQEAAPQPSPDRLPPLSDILGPAFLVDSAAVQSELGLTSQQQDRIRPQLSETRRALRELLASGGGPDTDTRLQALRAKADSTMRKSLQSVLTETQQRRLRELEWQQTGAFALADPQVATAIGLRSEQQQRVRQACMDMQVRMEATQRQAAAAGDPAAMQRIVQQIRQEQEAAILGALSKEQLHRWHAMLGKPFRRTE